MANCPWSSLDAKKKKKKKMKMKKKKSRGGQLPELPGEIQSEESRWSRGEREREGRWIFSGSTDVGGGSGVRR